MLLAFSYLYMHFLSQFLKLLWPQLICLFLVLARFLVSSTSKTSCEHEKKQSIRKILLIFSLNNLKYFRPAVFCVVFPFVFSILCCQIVTSKYHWETETISFMISRVMLSRKPEKLKKVSPLLIFCVC